MRRQFLHHAAGGAYRELHSMGMPVVAIMALAGDVSVQGFNAMHRALLGQGGQRAIDRRRRFDAFGAQLVENGIGAERLTIAPQQC